MNKDLDICDLNEKSNSMLPVQIKHQIKSSILKERVV